MSAAVFPNYRKGFLSKQDQLVLYRLWKTLCSAGLNGSIAEKPMDFFYEKFSSKKYWQDIVSRSPKKLFPIWTDKKFNSYLHDVINS